jgi:hypothetical protein
MLAAFPLLRGDDQSALFLQRAGEGSTAGVRLPAGGGHDLRMVAPSGRRSMSISIASLLLSRGRRLE